MHRTTQCRHTRQSRPGPSRNGPSRTGPREPRPIGAAIILLVLTLASTALGQGGPPPAVVSLDAARLEPVEQRREVTGELRSLKRSTVATWQAGAVVELNVDAGDAVAAGAVIARLDATLAQLAVDEAQARLLAARAEQDAAQRDLERAQREEQRFGQLAQNGSASEQDVDRARTALLTAQATAAERAARVVAAQALVALAARRVEEMTIRAPFAGRVTAKRTEVGQWAAVGDPIIELVQLDILEARLDVPEALVPRLSVGSSRVLVRIKAIGQERSATIASIVPEADTLSRLVAVRAMIDNADGALLPGMSISGLVTTGESAPTLTVSKDAIMRDDAGEFIYWNAGGSAVPARVRTRFAVGDRVAIEASIPPDAMVVVEGNERLFPGQPLLEAGKPPPASPGGPPASP